MLYSSSVRWSVRKDVFFCARNKRNLKRRKDNGIVLRKGKRGRKETSKSFYVKEAAGSRLENKKKMAREHKEIFCERNDLVGEWESQKHQLRLAYVEAQHSIVCR